MRRLLCSCIFFVFTIFCVHAQQGSKQITLEDIFKNGTFRLKDVPGFNAMKDGKRYTQLDDLAGHKSIKIYDLATGAFIQTLFDSTDAKYGNTEIKPTSYVLSDNEQKILLFTDDENIYRRSVLYHVFVYDLATKTLKPLDYDKVLHATFSPDGRKVAYVKNNNLYCKDLAADQVTQVTTDGEKNRIINGNCDWVYEEEFEFTRAFEWSSDSKYLAYYRFDESLVPDFTIAKYTALYPQQYTYKYPKAGERNSVVQIKIYDLVTRHAVNADLGNETDQYIPRIKWMATGDHLCVFRMNRLQNKLELLRVNAASGTSKTFYKETNKKYVEITDEVKFLPDGQSMVLLSEKDGYRHLYTYNWKTDKSLCLTPGAYDVERLVGVNEGKQLVYYTASVRTPTQKNLYGVNMAGEHRLCITPAEGDHSITPCAGLYYFLDRQSTLTQVPIYRLVDANGKTVRILEDNHEAQKTISDYALGEIKMMTIKGVTENLNAWIITPPGFDRNKKYPVLMFQYSGPGSQQVKDIFPVGNFWWHQMLAQKGYIIVCADGTGTGFRGEAFCKKTYLQLGKYESDDQIAVARHLGELPYVDKSRIGIWGWSYGGFMSSTCILKGNDVFKAAIAVAPVTNWRYYDNIYTERYMRTPQENPDGYDKNSPVNMVDKLKGKFLYIHGTADDNVHFQNSAMFTTALINANKDFDSEYYPDKNHGIYGGNTRLHLYRKMTNFIMDNL